MKKLNNSVFSFQLPEPSNIEVFCWVCGQVDFPTDAWKQRDAVRHCRHCKGTKEGPTSYQCPLPLCGKTFKERKKYEKHPHVVMSKSPGKFVKYYAKTEENNDSLLINLHKKIRRHESVPICIEQRWTIPGMYTVQ